MENNEFYKINEYKGSNEHVVFKMENFSQKETININESKNIKEDNGINYQNKTKKKDKYGKEKKSLSEINNKISQVTSNVASTITSAVTVGAVAVTTIITIAMANPPLINVNNLEVGNDYIIYSVETNNYTQGIEYKIEISNPTYFVSFETVEGLNENIVTGLTPYREYDFSLTGYDSQNNKTTYYTETIYTSDNKKPAAIFDISSSFDEEKGETIFHYNVLISDYYSTGSNYLLTIYNDLNNIVLYQDSVLEDKRFKSSTNQIEVNQDLRIEITADIDGYNSIIGTYNYKFISLLEKPDQYLASFDTPSLDECYIEWINDEFYNITIPMNFINDTNFDFYYKIVLYNDEGYYQEIIGNKKEEIVELDMSFTYMKIKYQSIINLEGSFIEYETFDSGERYDFVPELEVKDYYINYSNNSFVIDVNIKALSTYRAYCYTSNDSTPIELYSSENSLEFPASLTTYYLYLEDDLGNRISDLIEISAESTTEPEYTFEYRNPSEVFVSYNDDGTYNIYIDTNFSSEDKEVYYEIKYGNYEFGYKSYISQDRVAAIENISGNSVLTYYVYKVIDGMKHVFKYVYPSGSVEHTYNSLCSVYMMEEDGTNYLVAELFQSITFDFNSAYIELEDGTRLSISSEQFVNNDANYTVDLKFELPVDSSFCTFNIMGSQYYDNLEQIQGNFEMKGNIYMLMTFEVGI